jgi:hypothetical protein
MKQPDLSPNLFKFRVMLGEEIIGTFSNAKAAGDSAHLRRGAIVLDMSTKPPKVVYKDRVWIGEKPE